MSYTVHYWKHNLVEQTGHAQGAEISEEEVLTLLREKKVNILVHHVQESVHGSAASYCYIDDLKHRFQQR